MTNTGTNDFNVDTSSFTDYTGTTHGGICYYSGTTFTLSADRVTTTNTKATNGNGGLCFITGTTSTMTVIGS